MADRPDVLGGRLPLMDPDGLAADARQFYDRLMRTMVPWAEATGFRARTGDDRLVGPFNPVLLSPKVAAGLFDLLGAEKEGTSLSEREREVVILAVGSVWGSAYELYAHEAAARKLGISEGAIRALVAGESHDDLTDREQVAQRYTRRMSAEHRVDRALYDEAEGALGRQGLVDLAILAGCYHTVCFLLSGFEIPVPGREG